MSDDQEWKHITVRMPKDKHDKFTEKFDSKSGSSRRIITTWMDIEEEYDLHDEFEEIELAVLRTYLNAVEKNIEVMKSQRDKLQSRIEEIEEGDDNEILFEVDLRMKQWNL
jgi:hypothetical protein